MTPPLPGLSRRLLAFCYEVLMLGALVLVVGAFLLLPFVIWGGGPPPTRLLQASLFVLMGMYFVYCWYRTGQTLALRVWCLKVQALNGGRPSITRLILRYVLAWGMVLPAFLAHYLLRLSVNDTMLLLMFNIVLWHASFLFTVRRQTWHDRLSGTIMVRVDEDQKSKHRP